MREDVASDVTPSLAYASGCDCYENRNFKTYASGWGRAYTRDIAQENKPLKINISIN
jgi:hypothetical protein